jgi:hypothetical protein
MLRASAKHPDIHSIDIDHNFAGSRLIFGCPHLSWGGHGNLRSLSPAELGSRCRFEIDENRRLWPKSAGFLVRHPAQGFVLCLPS